MSDWMKKRKMGNKQKHNGSSQSGHRMEDRGLSPYTTL